MTQISKANKVVTQYVKNLKKSVTHSLPKILKKTNKQKTKQKQNQWITNLKKSNWQIGKGLKLWSEKVMQG